jgi:hypothetical protein
MAFVRRAEITQTGYGANDIAYLPDFTFPLRNIFGIGAILPKFHWQILQPEQYWVNPALRVIGNPGVQNGQMIGQPQIDTRGINGI